MFFFLFSIIGASLSKPHTSGTALQDACVCVHMYVRPYTENLNWIRRILGDYSGTLAMLYSKFNSLVAYGGT